jgi:hypothetical protein
VNIRLPGRSINRLVHASALVALVAAACAGWPGNQGVPGDPIVVRGTIFNKFGVAYAGADLELKVVDLRDTQAGQVPPLALNRRYTSNFDGTFEIHLAPSELPSELAASSGGSVEFELLGSFPGESWIPPFAFSRAIGGAGWAGAAPVVELRPPAPPPVPSAQP